MARLAPHLSLTTLIYALAKGARRVAENCEGQPARHSAGGLNREQFPEERLSEWLSHWSRIRHDEGAERTLLAALDSQLSPPALNRIIFGAVQDRIYADGGHALDHSNKAFEVLDAIGWEEASRILPLLVAHLTRSRSEEEGGAWRVPLDLIPLIQEAEDQLRHQPRPIQPTDVAKDFGALSRAAISAKKGSLPIYNELLGTDPKMILQLIVASLAEGVTPAPIARELAVAAAARAASLARPMGEPVKGERAWSSPGRRGVAFRVLARADVDASNRCSYCVGIDATPWGCRQERVKCLRIDR